MKRLAIALAVMFATFGWHGESDAESTEDIVVVASKSFGPKTLAREDLRPVFQTTKSEWPDGNKATPINQPDDSAARQRFDAGVLGLDPDRVSRYWVDRKIRGGERPPRKVTGASAVLRVVASDKTAVGYVLASEANDSVKIVARIRNGKVISP